jgi:hypothetical protein
VASRNLIACSLRSSRNKIPAIPRCAFDFPAFDDALEGLHRLRSCSPSTTKGKTMSNTTKPAAKVTMYPITAAIWRNETAKGVAFSVTIQRSYKNADGEWKSSDSLNEGDLLLAAKVLDLAHTEISKLRASDRQAQQPEDQAA